MRSTKSATENGANATRSVVPSPMGMDCDSRTSLERQLMPVEESVAIEKEKWAGTAIKRWRA